MTTRSEAFRRQAMSDLDALAALMKAGLPACHALHFLQMATEKLGRAVRIAGDQAGSGSLSHVAIVKSLRLLRNRPAAAGVLWNGTFAGWQAYIDRVLPLAEALQRLAPAVSGNSENAEYPWQARAGSPDWIAPAEHHFDIMRRVRAPDGVKFVVLLRRIGNRFDELFR